MLIYGSATMGATVHLHYCMDELVGWSLWHSENEECGRCGMKEDKTGCCKDEHKHFKLKADHQKAATAAFITNICDGKNGSSRAKKIIGIAVEWHYGE